MVEAPHGAVVTSTAGRGGASPRGTTDRPVRGGVCKYEEKAELGDSTIDDAMIRASHRASQHVSPGMGGGN
jgi:hypothetical protein